MARVAFSGVIDEIVGKLAGSVFQDSYQGFQIRTRVSPRNPQSNYQQLRRGEFGFLSAGWRYLSSIERQSFIDNAPSPGAGLNFYLQANVNLTLINQPIITTYVPSSDPGSMTVEFVEATPDILTVQATGGTTVVPAGTKLLVQVTFQKQPQKIFTNPSMYSPVLSFDEGTDLSIATDILTEWQARYGVLSPDKRVCLKANLINKSNGRRGADQVNCIITEVMPQLTKQLTAFNTTVSNNVSNSQDVNNYNIPANTFNADKARIEIRLNFETTDLINNTSLQLNFDGTTFTTYSAIGARLGCTVIEIIRQGASDAVVNAYSVVNGVTSFVNQGSIASIDFTAAITALLTINGNALSDTFIYAESITQYQQA